MEDDDAAKMTPRFGMVWERELLTQEQVIEEGTHFRLFVEAIGSNLCFLIFILFWVICFFRIRLVSMMSMVRCLESVTRVIVQKHWLVFLE